jgi:hypothetical protein
MSELTAEQKRKIIKRRKYICDRDKRRHQPRNLIIHHKDRNPENNDPKNLRVLCVEHHEELHRRAKR